MMQYRISDVEAVCTDGWKCKAKAGFILNYSDESENEFNFIGFKDPSDGLWCVFVWDETDVEPDESITAQTWNGPINIKWSKVKSIDAPIAEYLWCGTMGNPWDIIDWLRDGFFDDNFKQAGVQ